MLLAFFFFVYHAFRSKCARAQNNLLLTGGEDSKLHVWNAPALAPEVTSPGKSKRANDIDPMDIDEDGDSARKKRRG